MLAPKRLLALSLASLLAACSPDGGDPAGTGASGPTTTAADGGGGSGQGGTGTEMGGQGGEGGSTSGTGGSGGQGGNGTGGADDPWGPDQCPEPPAGVTVGIEVGQQLPDFVVKDCDGQDFSLSELCGAEGLFLFAAHGWCPLCQNVSSNAEALHDSFAGKGLATAVVVVQTGAFEPPTASYCQIWREELGLEDVLTLYDPTGGILDLWPGGSSSLSAFVDADRVIVSKLEHVGNVDTIEQHIQAALDH